MFKSLITYLGSTFLIPSEITAIVVSGIVILILIEIIKFFLQREF